MNRNAAGETTRHAMLSDGFDGARFVAVIDDRRLYFEAFPAQSRFRVTVADARTRRPAALGSVIRLDTDEPGLRVCAPLEVEWATRNAEAIVAEAAEVWASITRHREG